MAHYMNDDVPGVSIPASIIKRLEAAGDGVEEESVTITLELIEEIRKKQGVNGLHLMAVGWEEIVPRLIQEANLLPPDFTPPVEDEEERREAAK